jgi:hypothetical protein
MPLGEVLRMQKKCVIFYLGRVPSYFFILKRDFHYVGMTDQENNTSREKATKNGSVNIKAKQGMYGLPQSGSLANELLEKLLNKHGY